MVSRAVIEQAKGILMAHLNVNAEEAFAELVRRSQRANRKLTLIVADLAADPGKA
jgi:AmiR/NasT family two-component response regulator